MKKAIWLVILVLLFSGCYSKDPSKESAPSSQDRESNSSSATTEATSPEEKNTTVSDEATEEHGESQRPVKKVVILDKAEELFVIPVNQGENSLKAMVFTPMDQLPEGVTIEEQDHYEYGPDAFAVRSDDEAFVVDTYNMRVLRVKKGNDIEAKAFDNLTVGPLFDMILVHETCVYVVGRKGVGCWNTESGEVTTIAHNFEKADDFFPSHLIWQDGLIICNGYSDGMNLRMDEDNRTFTETTDGYSFQTINDKKFRVSLLGMEWVIPWEKMWISVVGPGPDGSLFTLANDKEVKDGRWLETFVQQYGNKESAKNSEEVLSSVRIPMASVWWPPHSMATVGPDGVYAFVVEEQTASIVKLISFESVD